MRYNNQFFHTREDAKAFQIEHGGALYSALPRSRTKREFQNEVAIALDARNEIVNAGETPWCVAWNEP